MKETFAVKGKNIQTTPVWILSDSSRTYSIIATCTQQKMFVIIIPRPIDLVVSHPLSMSWPKHQKLWQISSGNSKFNNRFAYSKLTPTTFQLLNHELDYFWLKQGFLPLENRPCSQIRHLVPSSDIVHEFIITQQKKLT